jgi:PTH1 family peptidyl-tRNA hydrolase
MSFLSSLFKNKVVIEDHMKYLVVGLGNIGAEYDRTRHNIGFDVLDLLANKKGTSFEQGKYVFHTKVKVKGKTAVLIKPTTYMNLSGKAVKFWMEKENIPLANILVVTDDINLPLSKLRLRGRGSHGGHNGLRNIEELLGTREYSRLRFGAMGDFPKGRQVEFVLGKWGDKEEVEVEIMTIKAIECIESFVFRGLSQTMTEFNK